MTHQEHCPNCHSPLPEGTPPGRCPQCLLRAAAHQTSASRIGKVTFTPPTPSALNEALQGFEVLSLIGQGGMGAVYKAIHLRLDRVVAVKVLPAELESSDPAFGERFLREARSLAKLQHPNLVVVHDFGEVDGLYFIVMEFVEGANLRQRLRDGSLKPEQALEILPQICEGLRYAHAQGLVHRDIKPENILIGDDGRVRIADFGLARMVHPGATDLGLTATEQALGTPHYMAPEQLRDPDNVDHRADLFSLGVVFYEMLTGNLPQGRFPLPSEEVEVGKHVDEVVLKSLEPNPERRYQEAREMEEDLGKEPEASMDADCEDPNPPAAEVHTGTEASPVVGQEEPGFRDPLRRKAFHLTLFAAVASLFPWWTIRFVDGMVIQGDLEGGYFAIGFISIPLWIMPLVAIGLAVCIWMEDRGKKPKDSLARKITLGAALVCTYGLIGATYSWMSHAGNYERENMYSTPGVGVILSTLLYWSLWRLLKKIKSEDSRDQAAAKRARRKAFRESKPSEEKPEVVTHPTTNGHGRKRESGNGPIAPIPAPWMITFFSGIGAALLFLFQRTVWVDSIDLVIMRIPVFVLLGLALVITLMAGIRIHTSISMPAIYPRRLSLAASTICAVGLIVMIVAATIGNDGIENPALTAGAGGVRPDAMFEFLDIQVQRSRAGFALFANTLLFFWIWWSLRKVK